VTIDGLYISFGHPDKSFDWKWRCEDCNEINVEIIQAMPMQREMIIMPNGQTRDEYLSNPKPELPMGTQVITNEQTDKFLKLMKETGINEVKTIENAFNNQEDWENIIPKTLEELEKQYELLKEKEEVFYEYRKDIKMS